MREIIRLLSEDLTDIERERLREEAKTDALAKLMLGCMEWARGEEAAAIITQKLEADGAVVVLSHGERVVWVRDDRVRLNPAWTTYPVFTRDELAQLVANKASPATVAAVIET